MGAPGLTTTEIPLGLELVRMRCACSWWISLFT